MNHWNIISPQLMLTLTKILQIIVLQTMHPKRWYQRRAKGLLVNPHQLLLEALQPMGKFYCRAEGTTNHGFW